MRTNRAVSITIGAISFLVRYSRYKSHTWKPYAIHALQIFEENKIAASSHLEATKADKHDVTDSNADFPTHFAADMAHAFDTIEAVGLKPGASVHLEHLCVLLALIYILEVQFALAIAIALCA